MSFRKGDRVIVVSDEDFEGATGWIDWVVPERYRKFGIDYRVKFDTPVNLGDLGIHESMNFREEALGRFYKKTNPWWRKLFS